MRRENVDAERPRMVLGDEATKLARSATSGDTGISPGDLDRAIIALKTELAESKGALKQAQENFTQLLHRFDKTEELRVRSDAGHLMMHGQIHRELKGILGLVGLLVSSKSEDEVREGDFDCAMRVVEDLVAETRNTLAYWRAREGLEMPEYDRHKMQEEHDRLLAEARMINARALAQQQEKASKQQEIER